MKKIKYRLTIYSILLILFIIIGSFLRFYQLGYKSLWWDELTTVKLAEKNLGLFFRDYISWQYEMPVTGNTGPLIYPILHFILKFGNGDFILRLPSAIFGILTIPVLYMLAKNLFNKSIALYSAFLLTISVFHIRYSQEVRHYSLFLLLFTFSCLFFYLSVTRNSRRYWINYTVATICMLFSNYLWITVAGAQTVCIIAYYFVAILSRDSNSRDKGWSIIKKYFFAWFIVLLIYGPYAIAQWKTGIVSSKISYGGGNLTWDIVIENLKELLGFNYYIGDIKYSMIYLISGLLGCAICVFKRKIKELMFLMFLFAFPFLIFHFLQRSVRMVPRHIINILPIIIILISVPIDFITDSFVKFILRKKMVKDYVSIFIGILIVLIFFGSISYLSLPRYYRKSQNVDYKREAKYLIENYRINEAFAFHFPTMHIGWYLSDTIKNASPFADRKYKRIYLILSSESEKIKRRVNDLYLSQIGNVKAFVKGQINFSPVLITPSQKEEWVYATKYNSFKVFRDFFKCNNMMMDLETLRIIEPEKPGFIEYKFKNVSDSMIKKMLIKAIIIASPPITTDNFNGYVRFFISKDHIKYDLIGKFCMDKRPPFKRGGCEFEKIIYAPLEKFDISKEVYLKIEFCYGEIPNDRSEMGWPSPRLKNLKVEFTMDKKTKPQQDMPLYLLENIFKNITVTKWKSGVIDIGTDILYIFSCDDVRNRSENNRAFWNNRKELDKFEIEQKDLKPIEVIYYADKKPAFKFYDPYLSSKYNRFEAGKMYKLKASDTNYKTVKTILMKGKIDEPQFVFNSRCFKIPVRTSSDVFLSIDTTGDGKIRFSPLFDSLHFDPKQYDSKSIILDKSEGFVTNERNKKGELIFWIETKGVIKKFTIISYPSLVNDRAKQNYIEASYSVDGVNYKRLYRLMSNGCGKSSGCGEEFYDEKRMPYGDGKIYFKFILSGDGVALESSDICPMAIDIEIELTNINEIVLNSGINDFNISGHGNKYFDVEFILASMPEDKRNII